MNISIKSAVTAIVAKACTSGGMAPVDALEQIVDALGELACQAGCEVEFAGVMDGEAVILRAASTTNVTGSPLQ